MVEAENLISYGKITMIIGCRNIKSTYVLLGNDKITSNLPNIPLMYMFIYHCYTRNPLYCDFANRYQ